MEREDLPIEEQLLQTAAATTIYVVVLGRLINKGVVTEPYLTDLIAEVGRGVYRNSRLKRLARQLKISEERRQQAMIEVLKDSGRLPFLIEDSMFVKGI